ncbi:PAS domain S-box protein [Sorangium sp. So ce1389]|uniref:PAS domain S-box protein n=1 Tax=Sorangium sp. So ce1389 TaxID=3133336 RepID=UPI003F60242B
MKDEHLSAEALRAENAELRGLVEQLRAQVATLEQEGRALRETTTRDRRIIERLPLLVYLFDLVDERSVYANRNVAELAGYSPEEIKAMGEGVLTTLVPAEDLGGFMRNFERLRRAADGEVLEHEYRIRKRDGTYRRLLDRVVVYSRDPGGAPRVVLGSVQDVTEQREAEAALARAKALVEHALDGIAVLDPAGNVLNANEAFTEMVAPGERVAGSAIWRWLALGPGLSEAQAESLFLREESWSGRVDFQGADGRTWTARVDAIALDRQATAGAATAIFLRDITAEIASESERIALQAQVIEAQASALRELGTPLIPIADEVLAMPLVGAIDEARAQRIIEVLLGGIAAQQAAVAILDITGVRAPGAYASDGLVRAARAARLLGAEVVLTGVGPEAARTLIELGADLSGIVTQGSFQSGIAYALGRRRRGVRPTPADERSESDRGRLST